MHRSILMPNSNNISPWDTATTRSTRYTVPNYLTRSNRGPVSNVMFDIHSSDMPNIGNPTTPTNPPRTPMGNPTTPMNPPITPPRTPNMSIPTPPMKPPMSTTPTPGTTPAPMKMPTIPNMNGTTPAPMKMPTMPNMNGTTPAPMKMPTMPNMNGTTPAPMKMPTMPNMNGTTPAPMKMPTMPNMNGTSPAPMMMPNMPNMGGTSPTPMMMPNMPNMGGYTPDNSMGMPMPNLMNYPGFQGMPSNMYMPNYNPYNTPMGVPMFPLYGYDNSEDLDKDLEYIKQLYPSTVRSIQNEVDEECDKMEYDGSTMFDEYPDKTYIEKITDRIYEKVNDNEERPQLEAKSIDYGYYPRRRPNRLRDLIQILLLNELFNRRRRYRSRKRWF